MKGQYVTARLLARLVEGRQRERDKRRHLFVGIAGGSASGKTTIARRIKESLAPLAVDIIGQDQFFRPRGELPVHHCGTSGRSWPDHNHPESFDRERLLSRCRNVEGADVAILEGILALHFPEVRELMDIRCYVVAEADERIVRRIRRNLPRHPLDEIVDFYIDSVRHRHEEYNAPQKKHADLVIPGGVAEATERDAMLSVLCEAIRAAATR